MISKRVLSSFSKFLGGNALSSLISLLNISIISSSLGLDGFGIFILSQTCYLLIEQIFNIRGWQYLMVKKTTDTSDIKSLFGTNNVINILAFLTSMLIFSILTLFNSINIEWIPIASIYTILILFRNYDSAYIILRNNERYGLLSIFNILLALSRFILLLVLGYLKKIDILNITYLFVITEILYYIIMNIYCSKKYTPYICLFNFKLNQIKNGFKINLTTIFDLPVTTLDSYIINYFFGNEAVGAYKLCRKYITILGRVISPLNQVLFPEIIKSSEHERNNLIYKAVSLSFIICISLGITMYFSIFYLNIPIFQSLQKESIFNLHILFILLMSIEILSLSFSIFNFFLISISKNTHNYIAVLIANIIFLILLVSLSYMTDNLIITTTIAMLSQVITLITIRLYTTYIKK
ncbi:lipopolysaccharide biosynthesis protein [Moellerella wisconsensis]|uniref:lipopolysaccharide biosynthesis protein n=1 Tax=Moellerella wisconsensis TaxID=158849 RepID=UPI001F4DFBEC|nr:oligosaccharide flippase family protein [Moellerella wisconsensis]UNH23492.1 oligosaccharide flippase family protein [Moellerella wisconsensis]